ncbi:MAG: anti-sigma factor [Burkholderiales bacterium]|nr:anti-sigma factor [Burkholderiales bacterium]
MTIEPSDPDRVGEDELHALVDGQLDPQRATAVLRWLQQHPQDAARVGEWQAQRLALRQLHRSLALDETPAALARPLQRARERERRRRAWQQAAAAVVLLGVGLVAGSAWQASRARGTELPGAGPGFVRDAAIAYAVYTPEVRHPVEVQGSDEAQLVQWLTRRLGTPVRAPSLLAQGFRLLGGRLLPGAQGPRAQFMYEDRAGRRVTLYVTVFGADRAPAETAFRSVRDGRIESFYWVDRDLGYAFSAEMSSAEALQLAETVYHQLSP